MLGIIFDLFTKINCVKFKNNFFFFYFNYSKYGGSMVGEHAVPDLVESKSNILFDNGESMKKIFFPKHLC